MTISIVEAERNRTIPYTQGVRPYHTVLARLLVKHTGSGDLKLFDFGCGVGNTLVEVVRHRPGMQIVVADLDANCLRITAEKVAVERTILLGSSADLDAIEERFDVVVVSHTLQYDPAAHRTMQRLVGLLRPGGHLLMASPNPSTPTKILHNVARRYYSEGIYTWDRSVLKNFIESVDGAEIVEITHDYLPLPFLSKYRSMAPLLTRLASVLPWLAFSIIVVVRKA